MRNSIDGTPDLPAPERSRRTLIRGVLVFRWVALAWMAITALTDSGDFRNEVLAWASIGAAGGWTVWLTVASASWDRSVLAIDLALCTWLVIASGLVVFEGDIVSERAFFATGYPFSAALSWGVLHGLKGGLAAGGVLSVALIASRPLNGVSLAELPGDEVHQLVGAVINYLVAGGAVGIVSFLLVRSAEALQATTDELVRERERAARLAERESLARQIHDSVLQALALIHKKGRELSQLDRIDPSAVAAIGALAEKEEKELRGLILREPESAPAGRDSLRRLLEVAATSIEDADVSVSCVGPVWIDAHVASEVAAAARQALANVSQHAQASRVTVFAEEENGSLVVSVRDDGIGFTFDEAGLLEAGKAGILRSMKGRIDDLGGSMRITSSAGKGTEVEFVVPLKPKDV